MLVTPEKDASFAIKGCQLLSLIQQKAVLFIRVFLLFVLEIIQEELKNTTVKMVEQSKVLNTPGAEKQTKRELFDALRQELE